MKDEWTARKWESPSDWVALVPGRILDFGGRVCGVVNGLCHGLTDGNGWTARKWESLRSGGLVPVADAGFRRACLCVRSRSMRGRYAV